METAILENLTSNKVYPSLSDRVQSGFIDAVLIVVLMFVSSSLPDKYENAPDWIRIVLFFALWAVYEPGATSMGSTPRNYLKGIRVRRYSHESKKINFIAAFVRYCCKLFEGWLSFITIHFNPEKRAIHDFVVGSVIVRVQKESD